MSRIVKREPQSSNRTRGGGGGGGTEGGEQPRVVTRERGNTSRGGGGGGGGGVERREGVNNQSQSNVNETRQGVSERRAIRSRYLAVKNLINDEREDISRVDSDKFKSIIGQVENLHQLVQKPREQVADAEALLDIANTLVSSVKAQSSDGVTPSDFITALLRDSGQQTGGMVLENPRDLIVWKDIGLNVSHIFLKVSGCCTMLGPMDMEVKQRKVGVQRKRSRPTESARPEELDNNGAEEKTDTDRNMATMFDILRKKKRVRLENLVLNRKSFAQTVENVFAMSFLVKDGRVEITVDDNGSHLVLPRNAPAANAVVSGDVSYSHFVFRFDYKDWKLMLDSVNIGEELMPHRLSNNFNDSQEEPVHVECQGQPPTTPIRKLCRNRGLVTQEQTVVEDSPESNSLTAKAAAIRRGAHLNSAFEDFGWVRGWYKDFDVSKKNVLVNP